jgi:hypothetical protein
MINTGSMAPGCLSDAKEPLVQFTIPGILTGRLIPLTTFESLAGILCAICIA